MTLSNTYVLDVDLKRQMTSRTPTFKKGDNGVLIFRLFDDGILYPINDAVKATLNIVSPSGILYEEETLLMTYEGARVVRYVFIEDVMLESGNYSASLTLEEGNGNKVSIQPFNIVIYNDVKGGINSVMDLVRSLQDKINNLISDLNQTIKLSEKGQPNGVATLDINGRIPQSQLPTQLDSIISHINHTVWSNQVHGIRITKDGDDSGELPGTIQYFYPPLNKWQNINFAPSATGSGGGSQYLDVELTKSNGVVTLNYIGIPTVELQKWDYGDRDKGYFSVNGNIFTGNAITVDRIGLYTLYYKDSNGIEYVKLFNISESDLTVPNITVNVEEGLVTVDISVATSIKKWAMGQQNIGYFQSQGNIFTGNTFTITEVGWYTIYYKATSGVEYIYQFEVDYAQLSGELPIVVMSDVVDSQSDKKYRSFLIGIKDSRVTEVKFTGRVPSVGNGDFSSVTETNGYYYTNGSTGFVDVTSSNHDMTVEFIDASGTVYGTAIHKCRVNYNYFVVNNQYISLTRIKNSTSDYTLPTMIDGLPVLDAGCVFFTNNRDYDKWNVKNLTVPSQIISGGRFVTNTENSTVAVESVRIENENFKFNKRSIFNIFSGNKIGGIVIYVPANSETYETVRIEIGSSGHQIQTF